MNKFPLTKSDEWEYENKVYYNERYTLMNIYIFLNRAWKNLKYLGS